MPVYHGQEARAPFQPEGDYILEVVGFEVGISKGAKTNGCTTYELELDVFKADKKIGRCYETLFEHAELGWKTDCFLKCCNVRMEVGQAFEFEERKAANAGVTWVDPIGLRGWGKLNVEEYPAGSGKKRNKVAIWYTDKPKLERVRKPEPEEDTPF